MSDYTVLDIETTADFPFKGHLVAAGIGTTVYPGDKGHAMTRLLLSRPCTVVCHTNFDLRGMCLAGAKLGPDVQYHDTRVMGWMLDATQDLSLDDLAAKYLGFKPAKPIKKVAGRIMFDRGVWAAYAGDDVEGKGLVPIEDVPWPEMEAYNLSDLTVTADLYETLRDLMQERGIWGYFLEEEAPFSRLLVEMEVRGVPFDKEKCIAVRDQLRPRAAERRADLVARVGAPDFNPGSPNQLAQYLYEDTLVVKSRISIPRLNGLSKEAKLEAVEAIAPPHFTVDKVGREYAHGRYIVPGLKLKAPPLDKNADPDSNPTTGAKVLKVMHGRNPWVRDYLEWKKLAKVLSAFLEKWPEQEHNGRIHGRFSQGGTVSGRLSSSEPNLQQVPAHGDLDVRQLFRSLEPGGLMIGDYAGLEARLGAHFSGDPVMLSVFREGKDLYGTLAAEAWGGPATKANENRSLMKVVWLASQYGARGKKLSETLSFAGFDFGPRKANALLQNLEDSMPRLFAWRNEVIDECRALGYVTTLAGRRRDLPEITSTDWGLMARAERQAVNSVVQGSAADVVRRAMLAARRECDPDEAALLLQVHDEILWERGPAWRPDTYERLKNVCETAHGFDLIVPLIFDSKMATRWSEKGDTDYVDILEVLAA